MIPNIKSSSTAYYKLIVLDLSFVCCPERTSNGIDIDVLRAGFGNSEDGLSQVSSLPQNTQRTINERYIYITMYLY